MNKEQPGTFIAERRKEKNMTQKDLVARLHITDKAVSKWERGLSYPDVTLLEPLTEGEADAWAEAHTEALGDALTTDVLKKDMKLDTSALQEAPAPKLEGLTN